MFFIISVITLVVVSHYLVMFTVGNLLQTSDSFEQFIKTLQKMVYSVSFIVVFFWILFDKQTTLLIAFATGYLVTLARIDLNDIEEFFENK